MITVPAVCMAGLSVILRERHLVPMPEDIEIFKVAPSIHALLLSRLQLFNLGNKAP